MKHLIAAAVLALLPLPAYAVHYDIGGTCFQANLPDGDDDGTCRSIGMNEGQRFNAFIDIDTKAFQPNSLFRIRDVVTDWRIDFGRFTFTPRNTSINPEIGEFGGTWFDTPSRFIADIDFGHRTLGTYLFLTTLNGPIGGELAIDRRDRPGGAVLRVAPVPLPAAGWLLIGGVGALAGLKRFTRRYAGRRLPA